MSTSVYCAMKPPVRPGSSLFSLLSVSLFLFFAGAASADIANGIDLRIHPIGDSITYGYRSSDNNGYRNALLSKLGGNKVQYIGSQHSGSMSQNANDGYSGFEIDGIAEKIGTALAQRPNVVLLMAGTNDINNNDNVSGAPGRLGSLLDRIISACPDAVIVLAKITPIADAAAESRAQAYNSAMVGVAQSRINAGHKIVMVDMQNAQTGLTAGDLVDGLHPTDTGYAKMATVWYNGMASAASSGLIAAPVAGAPISGGGQARCHGTVFWYNNYGTIASGVGQSDAPFESSWTLASAEHAFGNRGRGVRIADLDGDGLDDLIYIDNESGAATLSQNGGLMATGRVAWQDKGQIASGIGDGAGVRFADITGDGRADYIWISKDGDITAYVNNGPGGDGGWNWAPLGSVTRGLDKGTRDSIRFADLDGDGRADFSIVGDGGSLKSWIATGTASEPEWLPLGEIASGIGDAGGVQLYDLNGDGRADYIWVDNTTTMTAYMNLRAQNSLAPQWTPAGKIGTGFGINRADIIFGDLTGDGKADIKILDDSTDFTYINNGHGAAFQAGDQIVFADLDGDGFDDYISIGPDGSLLAYRNGGANSVANKGWVWIPWGTIASGVGKRHQIRMADLNGDGKADYIIIDDKTGAVSAYINQGQQSDANLGWNWVPTGKIASGVAPGKTVHFADINGDGKADYLTVDTHGGVTAYLNGGANSQAELGWLWYPAGKIASGVGPGNEIRFADIDGDGLADYLVVDKTSGSVSEYINGGPKSGANGDWVWIPQGQIATGVGSTGQSIVFGAVSTRGRADYLVVTPGSGAVFLWANGCNGVVGGGDNGDDSGKKGCSVFLCDEDLDCSADEDGTSQRYRGHPAARISKRISPSLQGEQEGENVPDKTVQILPNEARTVIEPRAGTERSFTAINPTTGNDNRVRYDDADFPEVGDWAKLPEGEDQYDNAYTLANFNDCGNAVVITIVLPAEPDVDAGDRYFATEHIVEMNTLPRFFDDSAHGRLQSGRSPTAAAVDSRFYLNAFRQTDFLPANVAALPGGYNSRIIGLRVPEILGSSTNRATFVLLEKDINNIKQSMWQLHSMIDWTKYIRLIRQGKKTIQDTVPSFRNAMAVFNYLNTARVNGHMITILNNIRGELQIYETQWNSQNPDHTIKLVAYWDEWIRDFLRQFSVTAQNNAQQALTAFQKEAPDGDSNFAAGIASIQGWVNQLNGASINFGGLQ